jgi:hypothetical protein
VLHNCPSSLSFFFSFLIGKVLFLSFSCSHLNNVVTISSVRIRLIICTGNSMNINQAKNKSKYFVSNVRKEILFLAMFRFSNESKSLLTLSAKRISETSKSMILGKFGKC